MSFIKVAQSNQSRMFIGCINCPYAQMNQIVPNNNSDFPCNNCGLTSSVQTVNTCNSMNYKYITTFKGEDKNN